MMTMINQSINQTNEFLSSLSSKEGYR